MNKNLVQVSFPGGKRVDAKIGEFDILTDQSIKSGGEASAPEPFDLFLASIATCAGIYALGFCQSRDIPSEGMSLSMEYERDDQKKLISRMILHLNLAENFPEKYRSGVVRAMEQCAVKKHVLDAPEFIIDTRFT
ncbi:MAG: osmotically inducible protein OsmC [Thiothrix sp.]|nr:MAG: osmotically inducible protein OsmC [Thiothrix sp.]